jgi:hypothetical protein
MDFILLSWIAGCVLFVINLLIEQPQRMTPIILFLSLVVAIIALLVNRKTQQRLKAQDLWSTYLQKAIEYPVLAYPEGHVENFNYYAKTVLNAEGKPDRREFERSNGFFLTYSRLLKRFWSIIHTTIFGQRQYAEIFVTTKHILRSERKKNWMMMII